MTNRRYSDNRKSRNKTESKVEIGIGIESRYKEKENLFYLQNKLTKLLHENF